MKIISAEFPPGFTHLSFLQHVEMLSLNRVEKNRAWKKEKKHRGFIYKLKKSNCLKLLWELVFVIQ